MKFLGGFYAFPGGKVDPADSGQHILYKAFMARNIDETQSQRRRQVKMSEAEVYGDAAALFFFEAVGMCAG